MVSTANIGVLRTLEGDYLRWYSPLGVDALVREIRKYDPTDAREVSRLIRRLDGADAVVPELVDLYEQARSEIAQSSIDLAADSRAAAVYLAWASKYIKERLVERDPLAGLATGGGTGSRACRSSRRSSSGSPHGFGRAGPPAVHQTASSRSIERRPAV
jgi:hypothetical protein